MKGGMRNALVLLAVIAITGALYSLWLLDAIREDRDEPRAAIAASTPAASRNDVRLDAWINDSHLVAGEPLSFWIAIQNVSAEATMSGIRVITFQRPGFTLPRQQVDAGCWANGRPSCSNTRFPSTRFDSLTLRAREARTIEGQLVAGHDAGRYGLSAVVEWRDAAGVMRRKPISVGPVLVQNRWRARALIAAQAGQRFFKDLAIPIMLAVLAFVLKQLEEQRADERKREADRIADEKKKAESRALEAQMEAAKHNALLQQTWTLMLPKAHKNAERHYMPLAANAELVETHYPNDNELVLFCFLRFFGGMRRLILQIGGFYLKNRDGEWLLSSLWDAIRNRGDQVLTRIPREEAQRLIGPLMTFGDFTTLKSDAMTTIRANFLAPENYKKFSIQVALLRLFRLILEYEMNDVYEPWYGVPEPFPAEGLRTSIAELEQFVHSGDMTAKEFGLLNERLKAYLDSPRARGGSQTA